MSATQESPQQPAAGDEAFLARLRAPVGSSSAPQIARHPVNEA